ncbi:vWA domain-containing protein [Tenuifilum thalassicum]|uniref:VWA domain-containing protein n=1 Tax=Tenuifilum thalassicum TaxID=2590900 RepID=A0A7D3XVH5_9BACT|nr:VWA domain-containing protein [Tenuifilum thalassicum]QKG80011.1 VWA domain-containing protein [Tenuifilum thalassicum]
MFRFSNPEYFYLLLLIPAFAVLSWFTVKRQKKWITIFGEYKTVLKLLPELSFRRIWTKFTLLSIAFFLIIVSLAGPQVGAKLTEVKRKGMEMIIALDVSNSMLAEDIKPNRIERAKQAISQLIEKFQEDRIGLIVFAGDAYVQLPVTNDYASAKLFLSSVSPGMVPKQGTAIGRAIELAANSFTPNSNTGKAIIVISDGENHIDDPVEIAKQAAENGIQIYTIGIGSPEGAPIPIGNSRDFLKDSEGEVVITRLDEETLTKVAITGNGKYVRATNASFGLMPIYESLKNVDRKEIKDKIYSEYEEQYQYILAIAIVLILVELLILDRKTKLLSKVNLFGVDKNVQKS